MWPWFWPLLWWGSGAHVMTREALTFDSTRIAQIHATSFAHGWSAAEIEAMLTDRAHISDVVVAPALIGDVLTGFAISRVIGAEAELLTIALDPEIRGRGHSAMLLRRHAQRVRRAGAEQLFLEVADDNLAALALYRRLGFLEIGRRKGYYPDQKTKGKRRDAVTMRWDLDGFDPTPRAYA
jgi:[ribosomal protein S18]-alanine N-acetyltransferase